MSLIEMMQIRGIRSFSPEGDENIEFYSPLTMIVGANGCGKTTIIESLKFACTGSLPPNTKSGQSMINDPSMTDAAEVKAHIKLRFKNRNDNRCVVTRALQVTKKRTKLEYKALEAAMSTIDKNGQRSSISMKCSEVDRIIPENLGVPAAILENVIFVHQEDSNWPMQEGMVLKKRFDDIFESTRYTKALEALTKTKKEYQAKAKDLKAELAEFAANLAAARQYQQDLGGAEANMTAITDALTNIQRNLSQSEDKLERFRGIMNKQQRSAQELERLQWQVGENERRIQEKERSLEARLPNSDEELQRMISNFEFAVQAKSRELKTVQASLETIRGAVVKIRDGMTSLNSKKGQAELLQEQCGQAKDKQLQLMRALNRRLPSVGSPVGDWNEHLAADCDLALGREVDKAQQDIVDQTAALRSDVAQAERALQLLRSTLQEVEVKLRINTDEDAQVLQEWEAKRAEKAKMASTAMALQRAQQDVDAAQRVHDDFLAEFTNKAVESKRKLKDAADTMHVLQEELSSGSTTLQELSIYRSELANLDATSQHLQSELATLHGDIASIFGMNSSILQQAAPAVATEMEELVDAFGAQVFAIDQQSVAHREDVKALSSSLAGKEALEAQLTQQKQALKPKEAEASALINQMRAHISDLNALREGKVLAGCALDHIPVDVSPKDLVEIAKATEDEARELLVIAKAGKVFMKRLKKQRAANPNSCPCCGQHMDTAAKEGLEGRMQKVFTLGDEGEQGSVEEHKDTMAGCQRVYEALNSLYTRFLPLQSAAHEAQRVEAQLREASADKYTLQDQLRAKEVALQDSERSSKRYNQVLRALQDVARKWKTVEQSLDAVQDRKKRQSQSYLSSELGSISFEQLEALQRERQERKDQLQQLKERLLAEEAGLTKRSYQVKASLAEATQALTTAKLEGKRAEEMEATIVRLQARHEDLDVKKKGMHNDRERLSRLLGDQQMQLNGRKSELQQLEERLTQKLKTIQSDRDSFLKLSSAIAELVLKFSDAGLPQIIDALRQAEEAILSKETELQALQPRAQALTGELAAQEHTKRNIAANLDLRATVAELALLQDELARKEAELGGDRQWLIEANTQHAVVLREKETLQSERDTLKGKLEVHRERIKSIDGLLGKPAYKGVEERHRRKLIEVETTALAVGDLENYYNALDGALQNFHTLKIREINKIIKELWQCIYQGGDIDTIELESGSDGESSGSRSYNYRVVMRKGDVPLDMRGRCSAGQKVLAAIVIRLALAETFCVDCGILALDEPTTNLDEDNKRGLAQALTRLIAGRARQSNFQLICITHDEEFVQTMRTEMAGTRDLSLPEFYFRVYRSEEGHTGRYFSHIERINWEDM